MTRHFRQWTQTLLVLLLLFALGCLLILSSLFNSNTTLADASATPSRTVSPSPTYLYVSPVPVTPTPTLTPIPTLSVPLSQRDPITPANSARLQKLRSWRAHERLLHSLVFISDRHIVAVPDLLSQPDAPSLTLWSLEEAEIKQQEGFFEKLSEYRGGVFRGVQLSPDKSRLMAFGHYVVVWKIDNGELVSRFGQLATTTVALHDQNMTMLVGSDYGLEGMIGLWRVPMGKPAPNPEMGVDENFFVIPDGVLVTTHLIDEVVRQVAFATETPQILVVTNTGRLDIYTLNNPIEMEGGPVPQEAFSHSILGKQRGGSALVLKPKSPIVAYDAGRNGVIEYDYAQQKTIARYDIDPFAICLDYSPDGRLLLIGQGALNSTLFVVDTVSQQIVAQVQTNRSFMSCVFNTDGTLIATANVDGHIDIWGVPMS